MHDRLRIRVQKEKVEVTTTHGYIWYLAKRLVLDVWLLLMLARLEVDSNELILDVALFGYQGYAARAGGYRHSVKFKCRHG